MIAQAAPYPLRSTPVVLPGTSWDGANKQLWDYYPGYKLGAGTAQNFFQSQQIQSGLWTMIGADSTLTLNLEVAGYRGRNDFGLYTKVGGALTYKEIFDGPDSPDTHRRLVFSGTTIKLFAGTTERWSINSSSGVWGWYLAPNGTTDKSKWFFSEDAKNPGGSSQMLAYVKPKSDGTYQSAPPHEFLFAWEDLLYRNSDKDFNDMVILTTGYIAPVPEPGAYLLSLTAMAGVLGALWRRRRMHRQSQV